MLFILNEHIAFQKIVMSSVLVIAEMDECDYMECFVLLM